MSETLAAVIQARAGSTATLRFFFANTHPAADLLDHY